MSLEGGRLGREGGREGGEGGMEGRREGGMFNSNPMTPQHSPLAVIRQLAKGGSAE